MPCRQSKGPSRAHHQQPLALYSWSITHGHCKSKQYMATFKTIKHKKYPLPLPSQKFLLCQSVNYSTSKRLIQTRPCRQQIASLNPTWWFIVAENRLLHPREEENTGFFAERTGLVCWKCSNSSFKRLFSLLLLDPFLSITGDNDMAVTLHLSKHFQLKSHRHLFANKKVRIKLHPEVGRGRIVLQGEILSLLSTVVPYPALPSFSPTSLSSPQTINPQKKRICCD